MHVQSAAKKLIEKDEVYYCKKCDAVADDKISKCILRMKILTNEFEKWICVFTDTIEDIVNISVAELYEDFNKNENKVFNEISHIFIGKHTWLLQKRKTNIGEMSIVLLYLFK